MTNQPQNDEMLDDVLSTLHDMLEDGASRDDVLRFASLNGAFRNDILAFVAEWLASEGSDLSDDSQDVSHTVAGHAELLEAFWDRFSIPYADPFSGLDRRYPKVTEADREVLIRISNSDDETAQRIRRGLIYTWEVGEIARHRLAERAKIVAWLRNGALWLNGGECCGQKCNDGVCMAPACIWGEELDLLHRAADAIESGEHAALKAQSE